MILREITESLQRVPDGSVISDRSRYDQGYLESLVGFYRARLLKMVYLKNNRINPVCYQKHWPEFEPDLQDDSCAVKFRHPEVISLDNLSDGFRYIGALSFARSYPRIKSRSWLSTVNDNQVTAVNNDRRTTVLYDGSQQIIEVYGNSEIQEIMTESLVADPLLIPTFNKENDSYPLNEDLIPDLINMIFAEEISQEARVFIPGKKPTTNFPAQRQRRNSK